jgi:hypothetical protein
MFPRKIDYKVHVKYSNLVILLIVVKVLDFSHILTQTKVVLNRIFFIFADVNVRWTIFYEVCPIFIITK